MKHGGKRSPLVWALPVLACLLALVTVWLGIFFLPPAEDTPPAPVGATTAPRPETTTAATTAATTLLPTTATTTPPERGLSVTSHKSATVSTTEPMTVFTGTSDPAHPLYINGNEVPRTADGAFAVEMTLRPGNNPFVFSHKGEDTAYTVKYTFVVMKSHAPAKNQRYHSGATFTVVVEARRGSTVTATFQGKTISLQEATGLAQEGAADSPTFVDFAGSFTLPADNEKDLSLGKVTFAATHSGITDRASSGTVVCEKTEKPFVGEIVAFSAETFSGDTRDDDSRPTNNYLPAGTVDYVVGHTYYGEKEYLNLRCGRRVYVSKEDDLTGDPIPVVKTYAGTLPATNRVTVAEVDCTRRETVLTLNTAWKAPFLLDLLPQEYKNPEKQEYSIESATCEYVEITFCYAEAVSGRLSFPADHPVFSRAQVLKRGTDYVLRLYLKKAGNFYGWDAAYNEQGQLEFHFLHPAQVTPASNAYGADLTGVSILIDVGHGGQRIGAEGLDKNHPESERNLYLAKFLQAELKKLGATVVLNRTDDTALSSDQRCRQLKALRPDLCIAIHHDGSTSSRTNGFGGLYSTIFSKEPARYIYEATLATGLYDALEGNRNRLEWHYYFMARMTACPVVLTENGFMTSPTDHVGILSETANRQKARAIAQGVADYFLSIRQEKPFCPTTTTVTTTTTTTTTTGTGTSPTPSRSTATTAGLPTVTATGATTTTKER